MGRAYRRLPNVGVRDRHVARLLGLLLKDGLPPHRLLDHADELVQRDGLGSASVRGAGAGTHLGVAQVDHLMRRHGPVEGCHDPRDDVADVGVVAR